MPQAGSRAARSRWSGCGGVLATVVGLLVASGSAERAWAQVTLTSEVAALGANALLGGLGSGIAAWLRGESFAEAFTVGAAGGAVVFVGKRVATIRVPGAGLGGRVVGAVGASMVRNAATGRGAMELVLLPVGPVTVYWKTSPDSGSVSARLNVGRAIFLGRLLAQDRLRLDWGETLSAGGPVFHAQGRVIEGENGNRVGGVELWGTITLSDPALSPTMDHERLLAHERVHLIQDDFLNVAWAGPMEEWLLARVPYGDVLSRYVEPGVLYMGIAGIFVAAMPYDERPWEVEASYLEAGW